MAEPTLHPNLILNLSHIAMHGPRLLHLNSQAPLTFWGCEKQNRLIREGTRRVAKNTFLQNREVTRRARRRGKYQGTYKGRPYGRGSWL